MSRNSNGTYTLPTPPVQNGTVIDADEENTFRADVSDSFTSSLSRDGQGAMRAPLKLDTGSTPAPSLSFVADPYTGLYNVSPGIVAITSSNTEMMRWSLAAVYCYKALNCSQTLAVSGTSVFTGAVTFTGGFSTPAGVTPTMASASIGALSATSVTGSPVFSAGIPNFNNGAEAIRVGPGTVNHGYVAFYASSSSPGTRRGYVGVPGPGAPSLDVATDAGPVRLLPGSGSNLLGTTAGGGGIILSADGGMALSVGAGASFSVSVVAGVVSIAGPAGASIAMSSAGAISLIAASGQSVSVSPRQRTTASGFSPGTGYSTVRTVSAYAGDNGFVSVFGAISAGGGATTALGSLPVAPAAPMDVLLAIDGSGGATSVRATISTGGAITLATAPSSGNIYYLDGLTYASS